MYLFSYFLQSDLVLVLFLIVSQVSLRGYTLKLLHDLQIGKKNEITKFGAS